MGRTRLNVNAWRLFVRNNQSTKSKDVTKLAWNRRVISAVPFRSNRPAWQVSTAITETQLQRNTLNRENCVSLRRFMGCVCRFSGGVRATHVQCLRETRVPTLVMRPPCKTARRDAPIEMSNRWPWTSHVSITLEGENTVAGVFRGRNMSKLKVVADWFIWIASEVIASKVWVRATYQPAISH